MKTLRVLTIVAQSIIMTSLSTIKASNKNSVVLAENAETANYGITETQSWGTTHISFTVVFADGYEISVYIPSTGGLSGLGRPQVTQGGEYVSEGGFPASQYVTVNVWGKYVRIKNILSSGPGRYKCHRVKSSDFSQDKNKPTEVSFYDMNKM